MFRPTNERSYFENFGNQFNLQYSVPFPIFKYSKFFFILVGAEFQVLVAQISKFKEGGGLGISLEGTVEKIDGAEQNPHHYIRYQFKIKPNY